MTGLSILQQAYSLLNAPEKKANADGDEAGLVAVNQIYGELWHRAHPQVFTPLDAPYQPLDLPWRFFPAMVYGVAMLLCLDGEENTPYSRFQLLYEQAKSHTGAAYALHRTETGGDSRG